MPRRRARGAMTLLEVIVALTVAGAALVAGASVLGFLTDQQDRAGAQPVASTRAVRTALRDWISQARLTTEGDAEFRGASSTGLRDAGGRSSDEVTFVTSAPTPMGTSGTIVHLYVQRTDSAPGLVAELRPWRRGGSVAIVPLAPGARGLKIRYLGSVYEQHAWMSQWVSTSVLPAAIELRVQFDSTGAQTLRDRAAESLAGVPMTIPIGVRR